MVGDFVTIILNHVISDYTIAAARKDWLRCKRLQCATPMESIKANHIVECIVTDVIESVILDVSKPFVVAQLRHLVNWFTTLLTPTSVNPDDYLIAFKSAFSISYIGDNNRITNLIRFYYRIIRDFGIIETDIMIANFWEVFFMNTKMNIEDMMKNARAFSKIEWAALIKRIDTRDSTYSSEDISSKKDEVVQLCKILQDLNKQYRKVSELRVSIYQQIHVKKDIIRSILYEFVDFMTYYHTDNNTFTKTDKVFIKLVEESLDM
jgi:hypothetical protein